MMPQNLKDVILFDVYLSIIIMFTDLISLLGVVVLLIEV